MPVRKESDSNLATIVEAADGQGMELIFSKALGKFPAGAKLLKGADRSYVLAPVGHIIEEKYSPYLRFTSAHQQNGRALDQLHS